MLKILISAFTNIGSNIACKIPHEQGGFKKYLANCNTVTSKFGLQQLINEPTHHTRNSSSCNDLTYASQPNLVIESGIHSSLHENCHHQIIYAFYAF